MNKKKIIDYYDSTQFLYTHFWDKYTLHMGFWDKHTKTRAQATENTNQIVAKLLKIKKGDFVLDAGCGVGGTCISIAKNYRTKIWGITLSKVQKQLAEKYAEQEKISDLTNFSVQDYTNTGFKNQFFTKIFGIESICHTPDKLLFLKESYRLLKNNGKILVDDYFLVRLPITKYEKKVYRGGIEGMAVPDFSLKVLFAKNLKKAGFTDIQYFDKTKDVGKSSLIAYWLSFIGLPILLFLSKLNIVPDSFLHHTEACYYQYKLYKSGIVECGIFLATKK